MLMSMNSVVDFLYPHYCRVCTGMGWDKDGNTLAIIQDKNGNTGYLCSILNY